MPVLNKTRTMFKTPFSAAYWRCAVDDFRSLRSLVFAALMIAACIVLSKFSIPIYAGLKISFGFLARSLCALVCGPVTALVFGAAEDTLSFFLASSGDPYFPGYMLTTMLGTFIYAGLSSNDNGLILLGAIPAALLAFVLGSLVDLLQRHVVPKGMRKAGERA